MHQVPPSWLIRCSSQTEFFVSLLRGGTCPKDYDRKSSWHYRGFVRQLCNCPLAKKAVPSGMSSTRHPLTSHACGHFCNPPQGKVHVDMNKLQGLGVQVDSDSLSSGIGKVPCWAFATFDGHAGPACAHYLKENFMVRAPAIISYTSR